MRVAKLRRLPERARDELNRHGGRARIPDRE